MTAATTIKFYKARRYRLHPTAEQAARLEMWSHCLIALWNDGCRAVEQNKRLWRMGYAKPAMVQRDHVRRVWMAVKKEHPESDFARLPADIVGAISQNFDDAIERMFKGKGGRPRFKRADDGLPGLEFPVWKKPTKEKVSCAVVLGKDSVKFPNPNGRKELGLGRVSYTRRQKIKGKPKVATISKAGEFWYLSIACEIEARPRAASSEAVGIDIGIAQHVTTSDGEVLEFLSPEKRKKLTKRMKAAQRAVSRARKGSARRRKKIAILQRIHAAIADARKTAQNMVARQLVNQYGTIVVEKLRVRNMTKSAAGSAEAPGRNVKAKSGLNREMLNVAPHAFKLALQTKIARTTGKLIEVDPRHTSQACSACGHISPDNRQSQARFECVSCNYQDNADFNAAINIVRIGTGSFASPRKSPSSKRPEMARAGNDKSSSLGRSRPEGSGFLRTSEEQKAGSDSGLSEGPRRTA